MKLKFVKKDFAKMQGFAESIRRQLGQNSYAQTEYAALAVGFSPQLKAMLRPYPQSEVFDFELRLLECKVKGCNACHKFEMMFAGLQEVIEWECEPCRQDRLKKEEKKASGPVGQKTRGT
jgi:hypothetical protein